MKQERCVNGPVAGLVSMKGCFIFNVAKGDGVEVASYTSFIIWAAVGVDDKDHPRGS